MPVGNLVYNFVGPLTESLIIDHVALAKQGDNVYLVASVHPCSLSQLNHSTFDLVIWHAGPWLGWDCRSRS